MFQGFADEGTDTTLLAVLTDADGAPVEPDAAPVFRVYGQEGLVPGGTGSGSSLETGTITGATNASPIVITSAGHGLTTGTEVTIASVGGNTNANGTHLVTAVDTDSFSLQGVSGNSAYTSGGTWRTTGLYKFVLTGTVLSGLEAAKTYTLVVTYLVSAAVRTIQIEFTVR